MSRRSTAESGEHSSELENLALSSQSRLQLLNADFCRANIGQQKWELWSNTLDEESCRCFRDPGAVEVGRAGFPPPSGSVRFIDRARSSSGGLRLLFSFHFRLSRFKSFIFQYGGRRASCKREWMAALNSFPIALAGVSLPRTWQNTTRFCRTSEKPSPTSATRSRSTKTWCVVQWLSYLSQA